MNKLAGKQHEVWQGLHDSPRSAPSKGAKLCTYHWWFACVPCTRALLLLALGWQEHALFVLLPAWGSHIVD